MPRGQRDTMRALAAARNTSGYSSSRPASVCCFESFRRESARLCESVSRSRSKSTAAATSGPASEPRPASSAPAMKRRSNERSKANRRRPLRGALERSDPAGRPVREEGLADDPFLWDGAPLAAIGALPTIVAHHKKVPRRNGDLSGQIAEIRTRGVRGDEGLLLELAVDVDAIVLHHQAVAGHGHHALDEVAARLLWSLLLAGPPVVRLARDAAGVVVGALRRLEDDDVPP